MRKILMGVLAACVVLFIGSALTAQAGTVVYKMKFDGSYSGVYFAINTVTGIATGHYTDCCPNDTNKLTGVICLLSKEGGMKAIVWRDVYRVLHIIRGNKTWAFYSDDGTVWSSGTWSWGTPPILPP